MSNSWLSFFENSIVQEVMCKKIYNCLNIFSILNAENVFVHLLMFILVIISIIIIIIVI
jgi:hypothetical protein